MTPTPLHIGALAARTGHSVHTIRWYEAQGLMPGVVRDRGGRRVYADGHVGWLELMQRLRRTGMSIAEMRRYTALVRQGKATLAERQAMLQAHRERVQRTIADWQQALALLDGKIHFYGQWQRTGKRPPLDPSNPVHSNPRNKPL
ncbi:MAG: MerR family transcriptional regulator [Burkholderiaceae bacterium]|jgi:DNA-binding transcriptional MerR regulator|nr:MerR family transcriptional regulator [Burkholderiaceae bacterium]